MISPAVPPTVVVEEDVHAYTRREVYVRPGDDNHLRRLLDIHRLRSDDYGDREPQVDTDVGPGIGAAVATNPVRARTARAVRIPVFTPSSFLIFPSGITLFFLRQNRMKTLTGRIGLKI